jgi:hypothetical protein
MSQEKGQYYVLSRSAQTSPQNFIAVGCLTNFKPSINNKVIDGTSNCGPYFGAGFANNTVPIQGFVDYGSTGVSGAGLMAAAIAGTVYDWRIEPADTPATGDVQLDFSGALSTYDETFATDTFVQFSGTIQVQTTFVQTIL